MVRRALVVLLATSALLLAVPIARATGPSDARQWAPVASATIRPGVQTRTAGQCTANFVFFQGDEVLLGQSAHCAGTDGATETNGCTAGSLPLGTQVKVNGASRPGTLVYSSWLAMKAAGERDPSTCQYNDFALVRLDPADHGKVNPTLPFWGGPVGLATSTRFGDEVYSYGSSGLRPTSALSPKTGSSLGQFDDGWNHVVYTATPGIPGDSGSAYIGSDGSGFGVLSTINFAPEPGSNGVSDLSRMLAYARAHSPYPDLQLALGTEPFSGLSD
jgi:hypothetical protein